MLHEAGNSAIQGAELLADTREEDGGSEWLRRVTRRPQLDAECQPLPNLPLRTDVLEVPEDASEVQLHALRRAVAEVEGDGSRALGLEARAVLYCSIGAGNDLSPEVAAALYACYVVLIQWANQQEPPAVIVCPDWRKYPGTEIFQRALNHVGFLGPFVTIVVSQSSILEPRPADEADPEAWKRAQTWIYREADQEREPEANLQD